MFWTRALIVLLIFAATVSVGVPAANATLIEGRATAAAPPAGSLAYVGNSDTVGVVDTGTGSLVSTIPVTIPSGLVLSPDRSLLFAASSVGVNAPGSVVPISTVTNTALTSIPVGKDPHGLAITPDGRTLYVANAVSSSVTPIDVATLTAGPEISVGIYPDVLAITPDGRTLYVGDRDSKDLRRINTRTNAVVGLPIQVPHVTPPLNTSVQSMVMAPDGSTLYVEAGDLIMVLDTTSNTFGPSIEVDNNEHFGMATSRDGSQLVVTNFIDMSLFSDLVSVPSVQIIDTATRTAGASIPMGVGEVLGVSVDPGGTAFVVVRGEPYPQTGMIVPIDLATGAVGTPIASGGDGPNPIALLESAPAPRVLPGEATTEEGGSGTHEVQVPVTLSGPTAKTVTAAWNTRFVPGAPGGQADPATDYTPASGTVTFAPGETAKTVPIVVHGDTLVEPSEYIVVSFHDPTNATMGGFWGVGFATITADDNLLTPGVASVAEGNAGTTTVQVPLTLSNSSTQPVTVQWNTLFASGAPGNQADPATDYTPASGTVTFAPGETTKTVPVVVHGDTLVEPDEYIVVSFHDPTNGAIGGFWGLGFGVITNDDLPVRHL